ncbi:hypothetical protein LEP1GSC069_0040 [Leptospira interrogans serovar Canicola str. Fiocruz LV133]|nr:hypothetical protein LEP1GSC069_0040 [Leptospira interrogans serovar Canicola str. Fiocruz LV133]
MFLNLKMWELTQKFNNIRITEGSQITKGDGFCRNYCVLLKISKKLLSKFFKVLGQVLNHFQEEDLELITSKLHHLKISQ